LIVGFTVENPPTYAVRRGLFYFLVKPLGQTGFTAVTFLVLLPFTQVIVTFFATAGFGVDGAVGVIAAWLSLTLNVGEEKPKP
jgi:hypothetical protein